MNRFLKGLNVQTVILSLLFTWSIVATVLIISNPAITLFNIGFKDGLDKGFQDGQRKTIIDIATASKNCEPVDLYIGEETLQLQKVDCENSES